MFCENTENTVSLVKLSKGTLLDPPGKLTRFSHVTFVATILKTLYYIYR